MKVKVLASGSKGNSCYVETKEAKILIDVGTTTAYIENELDKLGVKPSEIDADKAQIVKILPRIRFNKRKHNNNSS